MDESVKHARRLETPGINEASDVSLRAGPLAPASLLKRVARSLLAATSANDKPQEGDCETQPPRIFLLVWKSIKLLAILYAW